MSSAVRYVLHAPGMVSSAASTAPQVPPTLLGHRLAREWSHLRRRPDALRRAAGWDVVEGSIHDLDQVLAAVGYGLATTPANEAALRCLVGHAADDQLAARAVLQRLLPGLLAIVRRRGTAVAEPFDELIGAAWISITTFDGARRPACLAAALIDDARHRAFRAHLRRASAGERPIEFDQDRAPAVIADPHPADELRELFAFAIQAGIADTDLDLLRRLVAAQRATDVASELGITARTVRNRRAAITGRLRDLALAA